MNPLRRLRKGDWVRVQLRYPGLGRMVEISEEAGEVVGFVQASEEVVAAPSRSSMAAILQREDGKPVLFTPGRDRLLGVGGGEAGSQGGGVRVSVRVRGLRGPGMTNALTREEAAKAVAV